MTLGAAHLQDLIALAETGSPEKRRELLMALAMLFLAAPEQFRGAAAGHLEQIMARLLSEADDDTRRELAARFADAGDAPDRVLLMLALDDISIAAPVLERAGALGEEALLQVARRRGEAHRAVIAARPVLPMAVIDELMERGGEETLARLAENERAQFSAEAMERLVGAARVVKRLQKPMTARFDLPPKLLTRLYFFVSSAHKKEILARAEHLDPGLVEKAMRANRARVLAEPARGAQAAALDARRFVAAKAAAGQINDDLLVALIASKRPTIFLIAFAHFAGVSISAAQEIVKDRTWEPAAIAFRAASLPQGQFAKIIYGLQGDGERRAETRRILEIYPRIPQDAAERVMRFWRVRARAEGAGGAAAAAHKERRRAAAGG